MRPVGEGTTFSRRAALAALGAVAVTGFDPVARSWIGTAHAASAFDAVPRLDGTLVTDPSVLSSYATDAGSQIHKMPIAVLRPGSVRDIQKMVRFCRRLGIRVAARGQGHTTFGQAQVEGGLIVDMGSLSSIHSIGPRHAVVDAGLKWSDLVTATFAEGLKPPVLTGYIGLSIGGTLSVGGISGGNYRGAQVDHVKELEVVTGTGEVVCCSEDHERQLFLSVLAGLGQCGIITRATVELVPAKPLARVYLLNYTDNAVFFSDLRKLLDRGEFDDIYNLWVPDGAGGWVYQLNAVRFFDPAAPPSDAQLLRGLNYDASTAVIQDVPFLDYAFRVDGAIEFFKQIGLWHDVLHPWYDVFLPDAAVEDYVGDVVPSLTPEDVGTTGFLLLFPLKRSRLRRPLLRVPQDEWVYLFDILTAANVPGPNPEFAARMLQRNRTLFERARSVGGTRYPIGTLTFTKSDWVQHYGEMYPWFKKAKNRFDPSRILTPGPGIFT